MFYLSHRSGKWCFLPLHVLIIIVCRLCRTKRRSGMVGQFNSYSRPSICLLLHCRSCWQVSTGSNFKKNTRWMRKTNWNSKECIWGFPKIGVPQNGWFTMENPIKMDDLGGTTMFGNIHIDYSKPHLLSWVAGFRKGEEGMDNISSFVRMFSRMRDIMDHWIGPLLMCSFWHVCLQYILSHLWFQETRNHSKLDKCVRNTCHQTTFQVPLASSGNTSSCGFGEGTVIFLDGWCILYSEMRKIC